MTYLIWASGEVVDASVSAGHTSVQTSKAIVRSTSNGELVIVAASDLEVHLAVGAFIGRASSGIDPGSEILVLDDDGSAIIGNIVSDGLGVGWTAIPAMMFLSQSKDIRYISLWRSVWNSETNCLGGSKAKESKRKLHGI